jgi:hypothetical protein
MARVTFTRQDTGETLELDVASSVDLTRSWAVTSHPVERGAAITDHTQELPAEMQIAGTVTGLDVQASGEYGAAKFEAFQAWIRSAATSLWDVVIPDRPSLTDCLVTMLQQGMTQDELISVTIGVREVRIVDAQTTASLISAGGGGGSGGGGTKPPPQTAGDLATEEQDGVQGGILYESRETLRSLGALLGMGG